MKRLGLLLVSVGLVVLVTGLLYPNHRHWACTESPCRIPILVEQYPTDWTDWSLPAWEFDLQQIANAAAAWSASGVIDMGIIEVRDDICWQTATRKWVLPVGYISICYPRGGNTASWTTATSVHTRSGVVKAKGPSWLLMQIMCHEIGHVLGFVHDDGTCVGETRDCPTAKDLAELAQLHNHTDSFNASPAVGPWIIQGQIPNTPTCLHLQ